jgi:8-oxo-dGTP pyrophosphatase MutT (NUDIX family)
MASKRGEEKKRKKFDVRREVSAGGLIWRRRNSSLIEVVLVRPAGKKNWVLPKGHIESGESILDAALREAKEESGLKVKAGEPLGNVSYIYSWRFDPANPPVRIFKRVHFFLMQCVGGDTSAHDHEIDQVEWVALDEALARASHKSERDLIAKAKQMLLASGSQSRNDARADSSSFRQT